MKAIGGGKGRDDHGGNLTHVSASRRLSNIPFIRVGLAATLRALLNSRLPVFLGRRLEPVENFADEYRMFPLRFPNPTVGPTGVDIFRG